MRGNFGDLSNPGLINFGKFNVIFALLFKSLTMLASFEGKNSDIFVLTGFFLKTSFKDYSSLFKKNITYKWYEIPIFILMGLVGGLFGAFFNYTNIKLTIFRNSFVKNRFSKILEVLLVAGKIK